MSISRTILELIKIFRDLQIYMRSRELFDACMVHFDTATHRGRFRRCVPPRHRCCGLIASFPEPCASSGGRLPEALFLVFRLESQGANQCKSCRSRQELFEQDPYSNESLPAKNRRRYSRERASQSLLMHTCTTHPRS